MQKKAEQITKKLSALRIILWTPLEIYHLLNISFHSCVFGWILKLHLWPYWGRTSPAGCTSPVLVNALCIQGDPAGWQDLILHLVALGSCMVRPLRPLPVSLMKQPEALSELLALCHIPQAACRVIRCHDSTWKWDQDHWGLGTCILSRPLARFQGSRGAVDGFV